MAVKTHDWDRAKWIAVEGARTNNLKNVSVLIPKHQITVLTGVSGSGKSSLAFGTIAAEAQRQVAETYPLFVRNRLPQGSSAHADRVDGLMFTTVVDQRPFTGNTRSTVGTASDIAPLIRLLFSRIATLSAGFSQAYSFNHPDGMCLACEGLGFVDDINVDALADRRLSLREGAITFPSFAPGSYRWKRMVQSGIADPDQPLATLPPDVLHTILYAKGLKLTNPHPEYPKAGIFDGVIPRLRESYLRKARSRSDEEQAALNRIVTSTSCPQCGGTRLNSAARASLINGLSIVDWMSMALADLHSVVTRLDHPAVSPLIDAIAERLDSMNSVGLGHLTLDRVSTSLSGGEAQRIKVVRHLGSALSDVCYVFDEPSSGLHPHDVHRLLGLLARLRDAHNTVLVVEHHPAVIAAADHIIDLGPGSGRDGGRIQFEGTPQDLQSADTATGRMMHSPIHINRQPRTAHAKATIAHATRNNLHDVTVDLPLRVLTAVSGVAGSGKSTLFADELPRQHPEFLVIDQAPLRGASRSSPATILGLADPIRQAFSRTTGLHPSWFSPNAKGACPTCKGKGVIVTDLAFLDDVQTVCEACNGTRFNPTSLAATLGGHTIAEVLAMNASLAAAVFSNSPEIVGKLSWLSDIGLGYLSIGQSTASLSGGERQRLQLARTLTEVEDLTTLRIVLDEPTSGMHGDDVDQLLAVLDRLVDGGATIVAIEHDQRVIAHADHVIDIGPGAGGEGGRVVYSGVPQGLLAAPTSLTGKYLRDSAFNR